LTSVILEQFNLASPISRQFATQLEKPLKVGNCAVDVRLADVVLFKLSVEVVEDGIDKEEKDELL